MATIESLMVTEMVTAAPGETVAEVARRMSRNNIGAVLVVDKDRLEGLFSERDLLTRVISEKRDPQTTKVGDVATKNLVTIESNASMKNVLSTFRDHKFRHLPVVRGGKPVGIISTRDFHEYLVEGLERFIDDVKYKHDLDEGLDPYDHLGGSYGK